MATHTRTFMTSDLSGVEADDIGTSTFAVDGVEYAIDLTDAEAKEFALLLLPYVDAGRKTATGKGRKKAAVHTDLGPSPAVIRAWALSNGHKVPDRGRIPKEIRDLYLAEKG